MAIPASINRNPSRADIGVLFGPADLATLHGAGTIGANHGQGDGDPDRRVIRDVVDLDDPPLRLVLGSYGLARAADMIERRSPEDRKRVFLSERTDLQEVAKQ
jgi:hypothetical protein